ncbi:microsomal glutathione S-transferase 3-like [Asparagus officinalis]|uniref:microsomal glutathione S-transferase 3-like n=1 Tax=Asparagus officinalis TaxID=4686 RepID=UPI00098E38F0|nr:microsomal glutathione S-transferase 3-like [Asparagus officinalis]XP_020255235.1 microsomal glutathione S-transferase 3-like [Asparagus officinalis]XP_020266467.1 microsomal glutathione S-transferase 3-like [Asparagus officinalis]
MVAIEVPKEYGYVIFVLIFYAFFDFWMGSQVLKARRKYKVFHPTVHAIESENKDAKLFNCVQRGHQNSQEMMPIFFALLLVGGLQYPTMCAGFGLDYIMGRFFYFKGYSTGAPENRFKICGLKIVTTMVFASLVALVISTASLGIHLLCWNDYN